MAGLRLLRSNILKERRSGSAVVVIAFGAASLAACGGEIETEVYTDPVSGEEYTVSVTESSDAAEDEDRSVDVQESQSESKGASLQWSGFVDQCPDLDLQDYRSLGSDPDPSLNACIYRSNAQEVRVGFSEDDLDEIGETVESSQGMPWVLRPAEEFGERALQAIPNDAQAASWLGCTIWVETSDRPGTLGVQAIGDGTNNPDGVCRIAGQVLRALGQDG